MKYRKLVIRAVCALVILATSIVTIWDFSRQLQHALTTETYRTLAEVSVDYNKAFLDHISYHLKIMNVLADNMRGMQGRSKEDVMCILQNAADEGGFDKMVVCGTDGISCSNRGISRDISRWDLIQKALRGEIVTNQPLLTLLNGEKNIILMAPIHSEGRTVGILFGAYPLSKAGAQLLDFSYYSEGYGVIVAPDGMVILSSNHSDRLADEDNLFSFFAKTELMGITLPELKAAVEKNESRHFAFTYQGNRRFVSFTPTTVNHWYTFSLSSDATMLQQEKITRQIVLRLVLKLVIVGVALLVWILLWNRRRSKEMMIANQKYQWLLTHINGGMIVAVHAKIMEGTIATYVSPGFTNMTGYTLEDIQTMYQGHYLEVILAEDRETVFAIYLEQLAVGNSYRMPYRIRKKDGSLLWVMDNGYLVEDTDGLHNHSIITDITAVKAQEEALRRSEKRFSIAINASSGTLFELDLKRQLYTHFENAERIFGICAEKLLEDTRVFSTLPYDQFLDAVTRYFFHPDDCALAKTAMTEAGQGRVASFEARLRRFDQSYIWAKIDLSISIDEFGAPERLVGFMSDINDIKKQAELLESKVQTDPMTGLYNKIAMTTLANKVLKEYPNGHHALLVLDIDDFKGINDTLGHTFGDLVLVEICTKLKASFRDNDIVGRVGGDEFAVLMKNVPDTSSVLKKATELSGAFRQTYAGEKNDYKISCSIGIIMIEHNKEPFEALYRKADAALYQAKQSGKDQFVLYREADSGNYPIETGRTNDEELQNLKASHNMEAQIFDLLYTAKDFNVSINMALAAIGKRYHVSRVSVFENEDGAPFMRNIYEWCNDGVSRKIDSLQNVSIHAGGESLYDSFDSNGLLYCSDVSELPPHLRKILEFRGVLSTLKVTIVNDEKTCGFIGFDECRKHRIWTSEEIEQLSFLAKVLSVFLFKKKIENSLLENLHTRLKILDVLPDYVCVVNPETHSLVYANRKMQEVLPAAQPGAFCFTTLRGGQNAPCEICLMERIRRGDTDNLEIVSEDKRLHLSVNAMAINWSDDKKMVLLYGTKKQ